MGIQGTKHREAPRILYFTPLKVVQKCNLVGLGGGGLTSISRDMGICHYFGYIFWGAPVFWGKLFGLLSNFGYHFF